MELPGEWGSVIQEVRMVLERQAKAKNPSSPKADLEEANTTGSRCSNCVGNYNRNKSSKGGKKKKKTFCGQKWPGCGPLFRRVPFCVLTQEMSLRYLDFFQGPQMRVFRGAKKSIEKGYVLFLDLHEGASREEIQLRRSQRHKLEVVPDTPRISQNSRRLWLFAGKFRGFPQKIPSHEEFRKIIFESRIAP